MKPIFEKWVGQRRARRGMALVVVLGMLALLSVLIVSLLSMASSETRAAGSFSQTAQAGILTDLPVNLVMAQLRKATTGLGTAKTWASQPGMIRVFGTTADTNLPGRTKLEAAYKLYSSQQMVTGGDFDPAAEAASLADWDQSPGTFTDLNQPAAVPAEDGSVKQVYPILDPAALGKVDGFSLPSGSAPGSTVTQPLPMPVRWLYVLQDGRYVAPASESDGVVRFDGSVVTAANPITGRIAFWTDDESCKLNINTASEPTPWDTPRAVTQKDLSYGAFQPAHNEFQRYPGHPFTTALSPVFQPGVDPSSEVKEKMYAWLPRVQPGGTKGATVAAPGYSLPDMDRLFASVDEAVFKPTLDTDNRRELNSDFVTTGNLPYLRFFLTANSRAPELNLFGRPRVSLWPVSNSAAMMTAYDRMAAFCSSIGGGTIGYQFKREKATDATYDYASIPRNQQLYGYLQDLTQRPIPGFGGNFFSKWGVDRDQVLTEMFDYVRSTNLNDQTALNQGIPVYVNYGQVTPIQIGDTKGFGRFYTLSQFGFHFICSQDGDEGMSQVNSSANPVLPGGERAIEAAFYFEPFCVAMGYHGLYEQMSVNVTFKTPFTIDGQDLKMRSAPSQKLGLNNAIGTGWHNNGREHGGPGGIRGPIQALIGMTNKYYHMDEYMHISKASPRVVVKNPTMHFSGGTIEVTVYAGTSETPAESQRVQTFEINFPAGDFPTPELVRKGTDTYRYASITPASFWWTFQGSGNRLSLVKEAPHVPGPEYYQPERRWVDREGPAGFKSGGVFRAEDVVRSVVPAHGDIRLIAAKKDVGPDDFVPVSNQWWSVAAGQESLWNQQGRMLHVFSSQTGSYLLYGFCNEPGSSPALGIPGAAADDQLIPSADVTMHFSRLPEIRPGAGKLYNRWNDFDNGMAHWTDGAYINKPDEGNVGTSVFNSINYGYFAWDYSATTAITYFSPSRLIPSAGMFGSLPTGVKRHSATDPHAWETLLFRPELKLDPDGHPHPGTVSPRDHLIMDLFWMPVIEPYAISEPFSTAGKVNMNYAMLPFSYIRRATAMHGVLKSEEPLQLPNKAAKFYKLWEYEPFTFNAGTLNPDSDSRVEWDKLVKGQEPYDKIRLPIDAEATLAQADSRFASGDVFRSASEICELHLVRQGESLQDYEDQKIWPKALITGDNSRERPYTNLYPRLTTRSNVYQIHYRVQVLKKVRSSDPAVWDEAKDPVLAESRGSTLIERYLDPNDTALVDYAANPMAAGSLEDHYHIRVLRQSRFSP